MKIVQLGANKANDDLAQHLISNYDNLEFGLFVEANSFHIEDIKECYKKYPNVFVENIAIKTPLQKQDILTFYYHTNEHPYYGITTCDIEHLKKHMAWCPHLQGGEVKSFEVSCITLEQLFEKYSITELDWLYIDVEGIDAELLLTFDWSKYKIKRVEFEHLHLGYFKDAIKYMMIGMGYKQVDSLHEYDWAFEKKEDSIDQSSVNILFFGRKSKEDIWEYDYLLNDILPKDLNKVPHFLSLDDIRNSSSTFDVFVYSARYPNRYPWGYMPTFDETLECVLKTKPKIIIQLSDEFYYEDLQDHNSLGNHCELFLRQYHHSNYTYTPNTLHIPLGYTNGCEVLSHSKEYVWSFIGEIKSDRQKMIDVFSELSPHYIGNNLSKQEMCKIYSQSLFVVSGRGNSSLDCFRLYESSINGAIPVVVGSKEELEITFKYEQNPPWIFADTWENAIQICKDLMSDEDKLIETRNKIIIWWWTRISYLNIKTNKVLKGYNKVDFESCRKKLHNFPSVNFISTTESEDRRKILHQKFDDYGIKNFTPHIFDTYVDEHHSFSGDSIRTLTGSGRGPVTSHLKAIKNWYENTNEDYTFFCEDDVSFETVQYWNFTWQEFFDSLPKDWGCVQLSWIREQDSMFTFSTDGVKIRRRCWCDWSACAYLISRRHAKYLLDSYYQNNVFNLDYVGMDFTERPEWALRPTAETVVFSYLTPIYGFPLFVEDVLDCRSTLHSFDQTRGYNLNSYEVIIDWWRNTGKNLSIMDITLN